MTIAGFSKTRFARVHDVMAGHVERGNLPGLVTAVVRHGEAQVDAVGMMDVGGAEPMARDTIFRISSMTKPITAAATMILVEECRLRLDEPVDRLLPELANRQVLRRLDAQVDDTVPAQRPITVRDLLTFRAGFGMVLAPPGTLPIQRAIDDQLGRSGPPRPGTGPGPDEWIRRLGTLPLIHQPGERWLYNTGSDVLGVLIARASGQPFDVFLAERLFEPLGLVDTGFSVPDSAIDRLPTSYAPDPTTGELTVYDESVGGQWSRRPAMPSGAGGLVSTVDDYLAFGQMMLNQGRHDGERVLSRPAVELMTTDHLTPEQKAAPSWVPGFFGSHGWGFGLAVLTRRDELGSVGRYGWDGGMGTSWVCDPREDLTILLMTQRNWTSPAPPDLFGDLWTSVYQAIDD